MDTLNRYAPQLSVAFLLVLAVGLAAYLRIEGPRDAAPSQNGSGQEAPTAHEPAQMSEDALVQSYKDAPFKVVVLAPNPFAEYSNSEVLYAVTNRGTNDDGCGGIYNAGPCYFFLESSYYGGPIAKYVGMWKENGMDPQSLKFVSNDMISFHASFGDAGFSVEEDWTYNVRTASSTLVKRVEYDAYQQ